MTRDVLATAASSAVAGALDGRDGFVLAYGIVPTVQYHTVALGWGIVWDRDSSNDQNRTFPAISKKPSRTEIVLVARFFDAIDSAK